MPLKTVYERLSLIVGTSEVAEIARSLGLSYNTVKNYQTGRQPSPEVLIQIVDAVKRNTGRTINLNWLLMKTEPIFLPGPSNHSPSNLIMGATEVATTITRTTEEPQQPQLSNEVSSVISLSIPAQVIQVRVHHQPAGPIRANADAENNATGMITTTTDETIPLIRLSSPRQQHPTENEDETSSEISNTLEERRGM